MDESTRTLLRAIAESCRRIGSANDLHDRGDPDGASELREEAQRAIAAVLLSASRDDNAPVDSLFGPDLAFRRDENSWHKVHDYARSLLDRDLTLSRLKDIAIWNVHGDLH